MMVLYPTQSLTFNSTSKASVRDVSQTTSTNTSKGSSAQYYHKQPYRAQLG